MASFSERHGYKPNRSQLYQFETMDDRLRNTVWNFLLDRHFTEARSAQLHALASSVWTEVLGRSIDKLPSWRTTRLTPQSTVRVLRAWYFGAGWNEVYDVLEHLLRECQDEQDNRDANALLSKEGSAYRFVGGAIVPITDDEELAVVEVVVQLPGPFQGASQHINQAIALLSHRDSPDFRNAIKEAISAVESAVRVAADNPKVDIEKGLQQLGLHPQLKQAWNNMYNWTSDEDGVRHGMKGTPEVGLPEARYMVVACSAFVNYLVMRQAI